jgi:hypothetical protein
MDEPISLDDAAAERTGNWTIKKVPQRTRLRAGASAAKAGQPMWAWLDAAVELAAAQQERNTVTGPGPTERAKSHTQQGQLANGKPPADWQLLLGVLNTEQAPKWLRAGASRKLGVMIGIDPPRPPPRRLRHEPESGASSGGAASTAPRPLAAVQAGDCPRQVRP